MTAAFIILWRADWRSYLSAVYMLTSVQIIWRGHRRKGNPVVLHKKCKNNSAAWPAPVTSLCLWPMVPKAGFLMSFKDDISRVSVSYIFLFLASVSFNYYQGQIAGLCDHSVCTMCTYIFTNKTASVNWRQNGLVPVCIIYICTVNHKTFAQYVHKNQYCRFSTWRNSPCVTERTKTRDF